jgi:hypothetical protein
LKENYAVCQEVSEKDHVISVKLCKFNNFLRSAQASFGNPFERSAFYKGYGDS